MRLSSVILFALLVLLVFSFWDEYTSFKDRFTLCFFVFIFIMGVWSSWAEEKKIKK